MKNLRIPLLIVLLFVLRGESFSQSKGVVVAKTPQVSLVKGNTYALIIGISKYKDQRMQQLNYADDDAKAFYEYLTSKAGGSVPTENIMTLYDTAASVGGIMETGEPWLAYVKKPVAGDRVYIYYSGHGVTIGDNDSYLLPSDVNAGFNEFNITKCATLPLAQLKRNFIGKLTKNGVQVILIIDACRSKELTENKNDIQSFSPSTAEATTGEIMLLSSKNGQASWEDEPVKNIWDGHGVFTYYLLGGLAGLADELPANGQVTFDELNAYLLANVPKATALKQTIQTPLLKPDKEGNDPILSYVDAPYKLAYKAKMDKNNALANSLAANETKKQKGGKGVTALVDNSEYAPIIEKMVTLISQNKLNGEDGAVNCFKQLENTSIPKSELFLNSFKLNTALMDDGQQCINAYLDGDAKSLTSGKNTFENAFANGAESFGNLLKIREKYLPGDAYNLEIKKKYLFLKGRSLVVDDPERALDLLDSAYSLDKNEVYILHAMALILRNLERYDEAIMLERNVIQRYPKWVYPYKELGFIYERMGDAEKAEACYTRATLVDTTNADAFLTMGNFLAASKKSKRAIEYYLKAVALDGSFTGAYYNLAFAYNELKKYNKAEEYYLKTIKNDSTYLDAYNNLGMVYRAWRKNEKAEEYYLKAISINHDYENAYNNLGFLYKDLSEHDSQMYISKWLCTNSDHLYALRNDPKFKVEIEKTLKKRGNEK